MKRIVITFAILGTVLISVSAIVFRQEMERLKYIIPPQWKDFDDLDEFEKYALQFDSVYGDYLQWTGTKYLGKGDPEYITRRLLLDKSNKFAIKAIFKDTTGFFTKIPGDINFSGQWTEKNGKLILKFYFIPETWYQLFDSLKNDKTIRLIDNETIEINKNAETIWIMDTECKRSK